MPEKTLALKLTGEEVRNYLVDQLDQTLSKQCYLNPNTGYDFFQGKMTIVLRLHDCGMESELNVSLNAFQGSEPAVGVSEKEITIDIDEKPPNQVRIESGQPVPTLTTVSGKTEVKPVRYARNRVEKKNG